MPFGFATILLLNNKTRCWLFEKNKWYFYLCRLSVQCARKYFFWEEQVANFYTSHPHTNRLILAFGELNNCAAELTIKFGSQFVVEPLFLMTLKAQITTFNFFKVISKRTAYLD
jgi:hypothetical protein